MTDRAIRTTRENGLAVACPKCEALAGASCVGRRGERLALHAERHEHAVKLGAPRNRPWSERQEAA